MQPILLDRYADLISRLGADASGSTETVVAFLGRHVVRYVPFEHVNVAARLVVVGITPGPAQVRLSYEAVCRGLASGASTSDVLAEVKREASFGGPTMRPNLVRMLEAFGFPRILGIEAAGDLWGSEAGMMHATSVVPHAAFEDGEPFAGSFDDVMASGPLREMFERHFLPSLAPLRSDALFVALGPTPLAALDRCVELGILDAERILGAFAHPSSSSGSQVPVYLGERSGDDLKDRDPVRARVPWLRAAAARMDEATKRLGGGLSGRLPAARVAPASRAPVAARGPVSGPGGSTIARTAARDVEVGAFAEAGFAPTGGTKKVLLFRRASDGTEVYLVRGTAKRKLVLHPDRAVDADRALAGSGGLHDGLYHNENMSRFPRRRHTGEAEVRYGRGYVFPTIDGMAAFLKHLGAG